MSRVMELEDQIKKLQEEKARIYSEERSAALSDVKRKIGLFQFSPKELGFKLSKASPERALKKSKPVDKRAEKKAAKNAAQKARKAGGMYFDLGGDKVPVGRGRPPKEVSTYAAEKGVTPESLKRNADGTPVLK